MQRQLIAFLLIGGSGALAFVGLSAALIGLGLPIPSWVISTLCYGAFIVPIYLLHRRFTFEAAVAHGQALPRYIAVQLVALALASAFSYVAYHVLLLPAAMAAVSVICLTSASSFLFLKFWAFALPGAHLGALPKRLLNAVHNRAVFGRRVEVLSQQLAATIPPGGGRVLDLGCGDGSVAVALMALRPDINVEGVDVLIRPTTHIPVTRFDGGVLPFADDSFDYVTIVDVLHHTVDPAAVLAEAKRVARRGIVIKDHSLEGILAGPTLRFMDWVGNRGHDVVLPYNYLSPAAWAEAFRRTGCRVIARRGQLGLYPPPASLLFDRRLHFVALLSAV